MFQQVQIIFKSMIIPTPEGEAGGWGVFLNPGNVLLMEFLNPGPWNLESSSKNPECREQLEYRM